MKLTKNDKRCAAVIAAGVAVLLLIHAVVGCATLQVIAPVALPVVEIAMGVVGGQILQNVVSDADRPDVAAMLYYAGDVAAAFTSGTVPTAAEFQAFLEAEGIAKLAKFKPIVDKMVAEYAKWLPRLEGNPKLANDVIHTLGLAAMRAAKPYVSDGSI